VTRESTKSCLGGAIGIATVSVPCPPRVLMLLGADAPAELDVIGDAGILGHRSVAILCSRVCPATIVVEAQTVARSLAAAHVDEIGGFQSPLERRFMESAIKAGRPVAQVCGRDIRRLSVTSAQHRLIDDRLLCLVSGIRANDRWTTRDRALHRNILTVALANVVLVIYAQPDGGAESAVHQAVSWGKTVLALDSSHNGGMRSLGIRLVGPDDVGASIEEALSA
jgi:predicted Rossmann fold nucleotide-binding protein DprA/Smf involved in DNA uptake